MNKMRSLITLGLVALFALPTFAGELAVGTDAPDFTLTDQNGKEVSLSDFEGKLVVLEWVNPDCPYVVRHYKADTMTKLATKWSEKDVQWIAVNSTHYMGVEDNAKFVKAEGITYPVLADPTGDVGRMYHAKTTPHMFVIGKDGKVLYNGAIDDDKAGKAESPFNYVDAALTSATEGTELANARTKAYGCSVKYAKTDAKPATSR